MRLTEQQREGRFAESWRAVSQYFGSDRNEIIDNIIDRADRAHFYQLEDAGLLESRTESVTLPEGNNGSSNRAWNIHYWRLPKTVTSNPNEVTYRVTSSSPRDDAQQDD